MSDPAGLDLLSSPKLNIEQQKNLYNSVDTTYKIHIYPLVFN